MLSVDPPVCLPSDPNKETFTVLWGRKQQKGFFFSKSYKTQSLLSQILINVHESWTETKLKKKCIKY